MEPPAPPLIAEPRLHRALAERFKLALPYLVAALAIAVLFSQYSFQEILREMKNGHAFGLLLPATLLVVTNLLIEGVADRSILRNYHLGDSYSSLIRSKAAVGVIGTFAYALGSSAYALWIARRARKGLMFGGSMLLFFLLSEVCALTSFAAVSLSFMNGGPERAQLIVSLIAAALWACILFLRWLPWERSWLLPWKQTSTRLAVFQLILRTVQVGLFVFWTWLAASAFGLSLPLAVMAGYLPLILITIGLPVNVFGLGASQGAWLLLSPWAPPTQLIAFSMLWQLSLSMGFVLRGLPFLRSFGRDLRQLGPT